MPTVPPGRAGRLWMARRLGTAQRAVSLLDRKLRILRTEQERFTLLAQRTAARWLAAREDAERWLLRATLLGGQREVRLSTAMPDAEVEVRFATVMGARYPAEAHCRAAEPPPGARDPGTAAMLVARRAYQVALEAAVAHAAAIGAQRVIEVEVAETRRRLHAISDRRIPALQADLHDLDQRLEEAERAETVRLRWVADRLDILGGGT